MYTPSMASPTELPAPSLIAKRVRHIGLGLPITGFLVIAIAAMLRSPQVGLLGTAFVLGTTQIAGH